METGRGSLLTSPGAENALETADDGSNPTGLSIKGLDPPYNTDLCDDDATIVVKPRRFAVFCNGDGSVNVSSPLAWVEACMRASEMIRRDASAPWVRFDVCTVGRWKRLPRGCLGRGDCFGRVLAEDMNRGAFMIWRFQGKRRRMIGCLPSILTII